VNITRTSLRTVAALGAGIALTLAACGGDDDAATPDASTTEPSTASEATDPPSDAAEVPTAPSSLTLSDQDGDGTSVTIDAVDLPADGFVAIHGDGGGSPGPVIGVSGLLPAGEATDVTITLDPALTETGLVFPMVHIDTDSNGIYEFGTVDGVDGPGVTADGDVAVGPVTITIGAEDAAGDEPPADQAAPSDGATITIADFSFSGITEIPVGTTVVVTNTDAAPHTWSADDGAFDSGALGQNDTFEFTFTEAGEFAYHCNFHPSMTGTIVVTG
jgi:plastocyanin